MYIKRIELKNYRGHEHLEVEFQPGMTVIAGINGTGKTSLLLGLQEALTCVTPHFPQNDWTLPFDGAGVAHVRIAAPNGRTRFEEQYPVEVNASAVLASADVSWRLQQPRVGGNLVQGDVPARFFEDAVRSGLPGTPLSKMLSLPVVACYPASRAWQTNRVDEVSAATERNSRGEAYEHWRDAGQSTGALQNWVVAKSLERLHTASETGQPFSAIEGDELGQATQALRLAFDSFESLRYDFHGRRILVDWGSGAGQASAPIAFEHLSAGQRTVICLITDIARRMCLLNPHLGDEVISQTEGIVLIDELDLHLHPEWQRALTRGLTKAFPKVQFIVASHSPQVIGEVPHENVILLTPEGPVTPDGSYGMTSNQVLQELMDAQVRTGEVKDRLDKIDEALERDELDEAQTQIDALSRDAPELRELAGARALLKRKRVIGR